MTEKLGIDTREELEKIIEEKVEKRLKEKQETQQQKQEKQKISRRNFIKKIGAGTVGLGIASLLPSASALQIQDSNGFQASSGDVEYFDVNPGGPVEVKNADLGLNSGDITGVGSRGNSISIGDVTSIGSITDSEAFGTKVEWDTDFAFFGLRDYGSDRKDVVISNGQTSDNIRLQIDGNDRIIADGSGGATVKNGNLKLSNNSLTTNNFEITENSSTNSLDFNYTG